VIHRAGESSCSERAREGIENDGPKKRGSLVPGGGRARPSRGAARYPGSELQRAPGGAKERGTIQRR